MTHEMSSATFFENLVYNNVIKCQGWIIQYILFNFITSRILCC